MSTQGCVDIFFVRAKPGRRSVARASRPWTWAERPRRSAAGNRLTLVTYPVAPHNNFHMNARTKQQETLAQFLTPSPIGEFMASLFHVLPAQVRLLDAGAGAGALTAAFVGNVCKCDCRVKSIAVTAYELDPEILPLLREKMEECMKWCRAARIEFTVQIHHADFIQEMSGKLAGGLFCTEPPKINVAIVNPPYKKINVGSPERIALRSIGLETSNLYTGFVGLLASVLEPGGQLVAITPRSFCNGPYFQPFREFFLNQMELHQLHVFESRNAAFQEDAVLQENIIFHATKSRAQPQTVIVSSSSGSMNQPVSATRRIPYAEIVHPEDPEKFIHIPSENGHADASAMLSKLPATLESLGVTVSTGPVVDFRLRDALRSNAEPGTVPLLYACHFNAGAIRWPKPGSRKPNAILDNDVTRPWLVPTGMYLLTKRFTSKEEKRRVVACLFDPSSVDAEYIGLENHLNYFHGGGKGLERSLACGLFAYLNSTVVDQYFRCFSGHTQVNATDLRKLAYPGRDTLQAIGRSVARLDISQAEIDQLVEHHIHGL